MITHLSISDFAIIENTEVDFEPGLNIVTGETGSGKSIVITAISLALGSRADSSYVRHGKDTARIELLGELDGEEIAISREINSAGRNVCRVNGRLTTLSELSETAAKLADIHGQYDNQSLLDPENHIDILDHYAHSSIKDIISDYQSFFSEYTEIKSRLSRLRSNEKENLRKLDFYRYELKEIEDAAPVSGEDKELEDTLSVLQNSEKIFAKASKAHELISGDNGAFSALGSAISYIEELGVFSGELNTLSSEASDIYYRLEDISSSLRDICDRMTFSPEELDSVIERASLISSLKKKYGNTIEEILLYRDKISSEISSIETFDEETAALEAKLDTTYKALIAKANELTAARREAAYTLSLEIIKELKELNFNDASFELDFKEAPVPLPNGMDIVEMMISSNRGEPLKPLAKTASGGEISRIMLAVKAITSGYDKIPTLIFDEIDQGISGKTAAVVGKKLKKISGAHQVICITHLPQIAAAADVNYRIFKESDETSTYTHIARLRGDERIDEIARLLGGEEITETARQNAFELMRIKNS